jgi:2-oxoglutarate dehydrogenase E1 component
MVETEDEPVVRTAISAELIKTMGELYANHPAGFTIHPRLKPQIDRRVAQTTGGDVDWATAELMALGSLTVDGKSIRLAGQDSRRGTFTQRHAVLIDRNSGEEYTPLRHIPDAPGQFRTYDSLLSEYAAMGFEYGYSVADKNTLVLWEAQFGDFADGAQTIIDEFIASGEAKWGQRSSLTLLLPHGYEGQGPDHSTGRPERFLQLCAENNMTVAMCSTPANYFHLLRRQALAGLNRPLIAYTPKSLLRLKAAVSQLEEFTEGAFQPIIPDSTVDPANVTRVVLCSGKIYYDLAAARTAQQRADVAIIRLEQLYPLHGEEIAAELAKYPNAQLVWAQEEPMNQGGFPFIALNLPDRLAAAGDTRPIYRASRKASASPAVGSVAVHEAQQREVVVTALG